MSWYYLDDVSEKKGPVDDTTLFAMSQSGVIKPETYIWREGMSEWRSFSDCKISAVSPSTSSLRYAGFWIRLVAKIIDGVLLTIPIIVLEVILGIAQAFSRNPVGQPPGDMAGALKGAFAGLILFLGLIALQMAYSIFFVGKYGATPGKMICSLRVVEGDGGRVNYTVAMYRCIAEFISTLLFYIGYLMAIIDSEKRTLHDRLCWTRVVKK